ncbi:hypothetical protein L198_00648 [Cryptococcus wingfieldii CBS 7118]|uniref:Uncharacterized protein n=1 Tax=Cryptococcus wingfieldii CBS 7118 TaxID=1295528 RepID=A0A1E3K747_9TREE|nr:hypothetical protein L198_00648 [Cryptococcus wingfieldii CBS 7118]ODO08909.1 hypothetical protein L198_00648 [Cryptococcus wingfieldii CBS 7118]
MRLNFSVHRSAIFNSFLGLLDIKLGAEIVLLFGLINKVAGLYGLITIVVGGTFPQLLYYAYSTGTLFAFLWGLKVVKSEKSAPALLLSHLYALDHAISTVFHYVFFYKYWYNTPHDGRRTINSQAQQDLINLALSRGEITEPVGGDSNRLDELRAALAEDIWAQEKGFAVWTLVAGWALKIYFILILYSYAAHLASSTYHTLPLTARGRATQIAHPDPSKSSDRTDPHTGGRAAAENDDDEELRKAQHATEEVGSAPAQTQGKGEGKGKGKGKAGGDEDDFSWD